MATKDDDAVEKAQHQTRLERNKAARAKTAHANTQVFVATESFTGEDGGFVKDQTRVSAAWIAKHKDLKDLFKPLDVHYDVEKEAPKVEQATAAPGEQRK